MVLNGWKTFKKINIINKTKELEYRTNTHSSLIKLKTIINIEANLTPPHKLLFKLFQSRDNTKITN